LKNKQGPKGAGRQAGSKQAGSGTRTGRREKDTEQETTIQHQTMERLTQYIGGETGVRHQTNETRVAAGRCRKLNNQDREDTEET